MQDILYMYINYQKRNIFLSTEVFSRYSKLCMYQEVIDSPLHSAYQGVTILMKEWDGRIWFCFTF